MIGSASSAFLLWGPRSTHAGPYIKRSAIWNDWRRKPPLGAVEVDWGHPLANGLIAAILVNEGAGAVTELVRQARFDANSPFLPWSTSPFGLSVLPDGSSFGALPTALSPPYRPATYISAVVSARSLNDGTERFLFGLEFVVGVTHKIFGWGFTKDTSSNLAFSITQGGLATETYTNIVTMSAGVDAVFGGVYDGATVTGYLNGKQSGTPGSTTGSIDSSNNAFALGRGVFNTGWTGAPIYYAFAWSRPLSSGEFLWSYSEPFVLLRPRVVRRYFTPVTTPAQQTTPQRTLTGVGT